MHGYSFSDQNPAELHEVAKSKKVVSTNTTLTAGELDVLVDGSATFTLTLPAAALCRGKFIVIRSTAAGGNVTLAVNAADAISLATRINDTLTAVGDYVVAFSTGEFWCLVDEVTT